MSPDPLAYALLHSSDYKPALNLLEQGIPVGPTIFFDLPGATIGWQPITLPKESAVTGKPLSWEDKACLLQAGDMNQKFPNGKIVMGFSNNVPAQIVSMFKEAAKEFANHANLSIDYTDQKRLANVYVIYQPMKDKQKDAVSGHTYPLPPTTSQIDLDDTLHQKIKFNQIKIHINSEVHPLPKTIAEETTLKHTITHELAHAILGEMHPHDLDKISFVLFLQPFIKNSMKVLDSPDLTVMSYDNLGYHVKLVHPKESAIIKFLAGEKAMFNALGIAEDVVEWKRLDLVERAEYQLGYVETVVAIEKYGPNLTQMNHEVIHPLQEKLGLSFTLSNQGGIGILDASQLNEPAEIVLDPGFCPSQVDGAVYYNGYLSPMQGLITGPGEATIYVGHTDHWILLQGAPKKLIWEITQDSEFYTSHIFGFRPTADTLVLADPAFSTLPQLEEAGNLIRMNEILDLDPYDLNTLLQGTFPHKPLFAVELGITEEAGGKLRFYDLTLEELQSTQFQFTSEVRDPFTCSGNARGEIGHLEPIPPVFEG